MAYTIGEMSKMLNVSSSTIRYYDKEGLLPFVERTEGGIRVFKEKDYEFLKIIHCLKATGMQIKDIRKFILLVIQGDKTIDARLKLFQNQRNEVEKQIQQLEEALDTIKFKCWYYETAKVVGNTEFVDSIPDEELPEDLRVIRQKIRSLG
ncbi:MerR family transcriptional regulator [Thomasclavelia spiroformis]|uniref:MerR family transcriptional regulator n=1 Tax=Thomasclavelia spiroformis TaxID=29348 RepID=UPI00265E2758|nr:MerR family transcriptional regulator [Thomasclavelia spiroformis]